MDRNFPPIGFIADDITGATDLASALLDRGISTRLVFGPEAVSDRDDADAIVVALKIRSVPRADAEASARSAAAALRAAGAEQLFSKYCSTFDSTAEGNIGPISDALIEVTGARRVVHAPAYPANGRTVYLGHLFVRDELLSDSPMRHHPLNPMRESRLRLVLGEQTDHPVVIAPWATVAAGAGPLRDYLTDTEAAEDTVHHVVADALCDNDLNTIAGVVAQDRLVAGSAPFGAAFARAALSASGASTASVAPPVPVPTGRTAIVAGSMSAATREQVRRFDGSTLVLAPQEFVDPDAATDLALAFAVSALEDGPVLISTDHSRSGVEAVDLERGDLSRRIEEAMGRIAAGLVDLGVTRLIVAGGETSGAVADALALRSARLGPEITVGVPWIVAEDRDLAVAFKSGNFGGPTFFRDALEVAGQ